MRSVSETLAAAQVAATRTPHIHLVFTSYDGETTYDLSTDSGDFGNRIILIDHYEEPYNEYATIVLRNYDGSLPSDLRGFWTEIGYGDVTGEGNEYADTSRLWVKHHQIISSAGRYITVLYLEGMWMKLRETLMRLGDPPYYTETIDTDVVLDILTTILSEIDPVMSLQALVQDDGIINSYVPVFSVNTVNFDDAATLIYTLLKMTLSYLRSKPTLEFEVRYPQESEDVDATYQTSGFYESTGGKVLVIPNQVILFANAGDDGLYTERIDAQANDDESVAQYGPVPTVELAPEVDNQEDANVRAAAILARIKAEVEAGRLIIPHNCQHELYDFIAVEDTRV